jgi:membrane peptidoglycan carboxypeptidase
MELPVRIKRQAPRSRSYGSLRRSISLPAMLRRSAGLLARAFLWGHAALIGLVLAASLLLLVFNPSITSLRIYRAATRGWRARPTTFVPLRQIPRVTRTMIVGVEDYTFYRHPGVDL